MSRTLMVNNEKALSTAFSRLHDKADLVRALEKRIVDDHLAGFSATQISKRNECTYKRVKRTIDCYLRRKEPE